MSQTDLDQEMWDDDRLVPDLPNWLENFTFSDARAVCQGGCNSGAWMPAVTYAEAAKIMNKHGDEVMTFLDDHDSFMYPSSVFDWSSIAVWFLSSAVELFSHMTYNAYIASSYAKCT